MCIMLVRDVVYVHNNLRLFHKLTDLSYNKLTIEWSSDSSNSEDD